MCIIKKIGEIFYYFVPSVVMTFNDRRRAEGDFILGSSLIVKADLDNAELRELYPVNIIEVIISRRIKRACKIVGLSKERIPKRLIVAVPNGKLPSEGRLR
ncbi:unnamed protein product [Nezara viridula]|uniref:Uncharacterized protein n=1 Tax=Nezara viridula TaxID=85310 RepID=A0A9P0MUS2_NEZVI|nr:unnamed protein product [Nezara viridula]